MKKLEIGDIIEYNFARRQRKAKYKRFIIDKHIRNHYETIKQQNFQDKFKEAKLIGNVYDSVLEIKLVFENYFNEEQHNVYGVFIENMTDSQIFQGDLKTCWTYVFDNVENFKRTDLF